MCGNNRILKSTASVAVNPSTSPTSTLITPITELSPTNTQKVSIKITNDTPAEGQSLPVNIVLNSENVPVYDRYGNIIYGNQIYTNVILQGYYGDNTPHFIVIKRGFAC